MAECRRIARRIAPRSATTALPRCRDADDQKFMEAAAAAGADLLITKDNALLELARAVERRALPFRIISIRELPSAPASA
jgi:predicted nucleic acid-binding protein